MSAKERVNPRGAGHEPSVDPWKGLRGIMAGTLVLEGITILLGLTVITRIEDGAYSQNWRIVFVTALGIAMLFASGIQRRPHALTINLGLQVVALAGFFVHWSMGVTALIFIAVWAFILYTRRDLQRRMAGGFLPSQHD